MTLDSVLKNQNIEVLSIPDAAIRAQAIRLGIYEGATVMCSEKVPGGPVILQNRMQEIAIGRNLAKKIKVRLVAKQTARGELHVAVS